MHPTPTHYLTPFKQIVAQSLKTTLTTLAPQFASENIENSLGVPPSLDMGQLAFPCFPLAKELKSAPPKIAALIVDEIKKSLPALIKDVKVAGGYVNFFINYNESAKSFSKSVFQKTYFKELSHIKREQIDIEYSQPNTHKALHLGHMRNLFYGDSVSHLLESVGYKVIRTTYPGDLGAHIARVLWYLKQIPRETWPKGADKAIWLGKQYALSTQAMNSLGDVEKEKATKEIQEILRNLQDLKGDDYALYLETREWSLAEMKRVYEWSNSHFHKWYYESECDEASRKLVVEYLEKNIFQKNEGAVGVQLGNHKGEELGFALLLKSDGNGLYLTKDLELIRRKFSDAHTARAIYIVDSRQKLHFKQLFKVAELMGFPQATRSEHLSYESVNDEKGEAFSSRDARGLSLEELRDQIENIVTKDYLDRYKDEWSAEEIKKTSQKITLAALKYGMLRIDPSSPIKFILSQWIALEGETGPYLQYVTTRCKSLLTKAGEIDFSKVCLELSTSQEEELYYALYRFNEIVQAAAHEYRPNHLANYLFDVAKLFNRFYKDCPVLNVEEKIKNSRLTLVKLTLEFLEEGFKLLNIPTIERM
jgi:arginyl-tRNA synthetase